MLYLDEGVGSTSGQINGQMDGGVLEREEVGVAAIVVGMEHERIIGYHASWTVTTGPGRAMKHGLA